MARSSVFLIGLRDRLLPFRLLGLFQLHTLLVQWCWIYCSVLPGTLFAVGQEVHYSGDRFLVELGLLVVLVVRLRWGMLRL